MKRNINKFFVVIFSMALFVVFSTPLLAEEISSNKDFYTGEISDGEYMTFESEDDYIFYILNIDSNIMTLAPCIPGSPGYPTCTPPSGDYSTVKIADSYTTVSGSLGRSSITPKNTTAKYVTLRKETTYSASATIETKWGISVSFGVSRKQGVDITYENPGKCGYLEARGTTKVTKYITSYFKKGSSTPYKNVTSYSGVGTILDYRFVLQPLSNCP